MLMSVTHIAKLFLASIIFAFDRLTMCCTRNRCQEDRKITNLFGVKIFFFSVLLNIRGGTKDSIRTFAVASYFSVGVVFQLFRFFPQKVLYSAANIYCFHFIYLCN
jgi:hypothetical protein